MTLSHRFSWLASTGPVFSRKYWFSRSASACRAGYKSDWPLYCGPLMTGIWQIMILLESNPNIQQMGGLMAAADDAQKDPNQNLDGSNQVTDIMASESTAESESTDTDSTDTESQPAA